MVKKIYEFEAKTTNGRTVASRKGTIEKIYNSLIKGEILDAETIEDWIFKNKLSNKDNEDREKYLNNELDDDYPIDELFNKVSYAAIGLTDEEMMDIISCQTSNMYYQEWHEINVKGERIEYLEELENLVTETTERFNKNNLDDIYLTSNIEFTNHLYDEGYDLKFELEALSYEQVEEICEFIKEITEKEL